jgi:Fe-S cluster biogenesis protein NfuA
MTEKAATEECIFKVLKTINQYCENDEGALDFVGLSEDFILTISFRGTCAKCKKNNKHHRHVIKEMFEEVLPGKIKQIKYKNSNSK